jgi:hypothetical protein
VLLSSTNLVHNDPDIRNESADSSINDPDIYWMHPDVLDHSDFEIKLWLKVGQVASTMNFGLHYEFSITLV